MAWDKLEIEQSIKEQTLEATAIQEAPLLNLAESTMTDEGLEEVQEEADDTETSAPDEAPRKKSRRRSRHRRKKPQDQTAESVSPDDLLGELTTASLPPIPRIQSPGLPVRPLRTISALPDVFFPVEPGDGDLFAPGSEPGTREDNDEQ